MGRAARNVNGHVILYADKITKSIDFAVKETQRRRKKQEKHNTENGIIPQTIIKEIGNFDLPISKKEIQKYGEGSNEIIFFTNGSRQNAIKQLQKLMDKAIRKMDYETALGLKEQIKKLKSESAA